MALTINTNASSLHAQHNVPTSQKESATTTSRHSTVLRNNPVRDTVDTNSTDEKRQVSDAGGTQADIAARSLITDADTAQEVSATTRENILKQSDVSLSAQANQTPQKAFPLLQG